MFDLSANLELSQVVFKKIFLHARYGDNLSHLL